MSKHQLLHLRELGREFADEPQRSAHAACAASVRPGNAGFRRCLDRILTWLLTIRPNRSRFHASMGPGHERRRLPIKLVYR
jgi:hypothetical protein